MFSRKIAKMGCGKRFVEENQLARMTTSIYSQTLFISLHRQFRGPQLTLDEDLSLRSGALSPGTWIHEAGEATTRARLGDSDGVNRRWEKRQPTTGFGREREREGISEGPASYRVEEVELNFYWVIL